MASSEFEHNIRSRMELNEASEIPAELLWDNISGDLLGGLQREKKRRRFLFWIRFGSITVLLMLIPTFLVWQNASKVELGYFPIPLRGKMQTENIVVDRTTSVLPSQEENGKIEPQTDHHQLTTSFAYTQNLNQTFDPIPQLHSTLPLHIIYENQNTLSLSTNRLKILDQNRFENLSTLPTLSLGVVGPEQEVPFTDVILSHSSPWSIQILAGFNSFSSEYKRSSGTEAILPNETNLLGWQAEIYLRRQLKNNWYVQAGVGFEQLRYRFNSYSEEVTTLYRPNTIDTISIDLVFQDTTFIYTDSIPGIRTRDVQQFNQHFMANLPILLGYQWKQRVYSIGVQGGINLKYLISSTGKTNLPNGVITEIGNQNLYRQGLGVSALLGTQFNYQLHPRLDLIATLNAEKSFQNWISNDFPGLTQRPLLFRFNIGFAWNL